MKNHTYIYRETERLVCYVFLSFTELVDTELLHTQTVFWMSAAAEEAEVGIIAFPGHT